MLLRATRAWPLLLVQSVIGCNDSPVMSPTVNAGSNEDGGSAKECRSESNCPGERPFCEADRCVACRIDSDCRELTALCRQGQCVRQACTLSEDEIRARCADSGRFCLTLTSYNCEAAECIYGPRRCDDFDPCTSDVCDEQADICRHTFDPPVAIESGRLCDNGKDDDCDGAIDIEEVSCGGCAKDEDCSDRNDCTEDRCINNTCTNTVIAASLDCDDGDDCTQDDMCNNGVCRGRGRDQDSDDFVDVDCGGLDCDDRDPTRNPAMLEEPGELCSDGVDNDCDQLIDALDLSCHPICLRGWCWEKPILHGWSLKGAGTSAGGQHVWFVGTEGATLRWDGSHWSVYDSGVTESLFGVWGSPSGSVWAVGAAGHVLRWDGADWKELSSPAPGTELRSIHGTSDTNVWVGGDKGRVYRWDGGSWTVYPVDLEPEQAVNALVVTSTGAVWAGLKRLYSLNNNGTWVSARIGNDGVFQLSRVTDDNMWAATGRTVFHYDGSAWTEHPGAPSNVRGIWAASSTDVWAITEFKFVGGNGAYHFDGTSWVRRLSPKDAYQLAGTGPDDVWFAGSGGRMHWWNRDKKLHLLWDTVAPDLGASERKLFSLFALSANRAWATGEYGAIFEWNGRDWRELPKNHNDANTSNVEDGNFDIWGLAPDDLYLVGANQYPARSHAAGFMEHWDGSKWTVVANSGYQLRAVWGSSTDDIWVAAGDNASSAVKHFNGTELVDIDVGPVPRFLSHVDGSSANDIWFLGKDELLHVTETGGKVVTLPCDGLVLSALSVAGPGDVWVGARSFGGQACPEGGVVLRYRDGAWSVARTSLELTGRVVDIWATASEVWVLDERDLHHWNGVWQVTARAGVGIKRLGGSPDARAVWGIASPRTIRRLR